jgi:hypothetical protein
MSFSASIADRPDWKYSFFMANYERPLDEMAVPILRQKCPVCDGALVSIRGVAWCSRCHTVANTGRNRSQTALFTNRLNRRSSDFRY